MLSEWRRKLRGVRNDIETLARHMAACAIDSEGMPDHIELVEKRALRTEVWTLWKLTKLPSRTRNRRWGLLVFPMSALGPGCVKTPVSTTDERVINKFLNSVRL